MGLLCSVWHWLKDYEALKSGGAELVGRVVRADLLVTSRSCAALVLVQMYTAENIVCHLAWMDVAVLLRVRIDSLEAGWHKRNWVGRLSRLMGLISQLAVEG